MPYPVYDMTGEAHGLLTVIRRAGNDNERRATWLCECACGNEKVITGRYIRAGKTRSCGCLRSEVARSLNK